jgi:hypothetical protein
MAWWKSFRSIRMAAVIALVAGINPASTAEPAPSSLSKPAAIQLNEASFRCIRDMKRVRGFFVDNLLGNVDATVAVAESATGGAYPPGSLVQVIPTTAMIKHRPGYNPQTNDWEFIELDVAAKGVTIIGRGFAELNMRSAGLNCFACHQPAKAKWDMICDRTHDCTPIPLTPAMMIALQNTDPRCPKVDLPREQVEALAALAARPAGPPTPQGQPPKR